MDQETPFRQCDNGIEIFVRVTPKSARDQVEGVALGADGRPRLKVRVTAIADKGAANKAVLKTLAKALGVPKSSLSITSGTTDRHKTILASAAGDDLTARLLSFMEDSP